MPTILEPNNTAELAQMLMAAQQQGLAITPRGGGTKQQWGNAPSRPCTILSTARLNQIVEHAWGDMTATVQAGCTIAHLQNTLAAHGQRLALDPLWPEQATVGGILATNDSGALRLRFGGLRDLIIGITVALPDGTVAMSGGKVVKNVAGYDLSKLMTGALGTLGVITQAVFRLHPLPQAARTLTLVPQDRGAAQRLLLALQNSQLAHAALQLRADNGGALQVDVLLEGTEVGIAAQQTQIRALAGSAPIEEAAVTVWEARQQLWPGTEDQAVGKISVLPSQWADLIAQVERAATGPWSLVAQATGLGCLRMAGDWAGLRQVCEAQGGSVVILKPAASASLEAWGSVGDTGPVLRALKQQFDPGNTLNPGRFAGGI